MSKQLNLFSTPESAFSPVPGTKLLTVCNCDPYLYVCDPPYNLPPTYKEGAKKCILVNDIISPYDKRLLYDKGVEGVVISIGKQRYLDMFRYHQEFIDGRFTTFNKGFALCNKVYDFFPFRISRKTNKREVSNWHTHISAFDFEYL